MFILKVQMEKMFENEQSCLVVRGDKLYVLSKDLSDYYAGAITVMPGFQIELGRPLEQFKEATKKTRLPIGYMLLKERNNVALYKVIRLKTGPLSNTVVATLRCVDDRIVAIAFNRSLLNDNNYRRYGKLSAMHQLAIPTSLQGYGYRRAQASAIISNLLSINSDVEVIESEAKLEVKVQASICRYNFTFIKSLDGNRYELSWIALKDD